MTLGKKLSRLRGLADLTQAQLGEKLSVSPQAISKWENDLAEPDLATLRKLADLYQVTLDELLNLEEEKEAEEETPAPAAEATKEETPAEEAKEETPAAPEHIVIVPPTIEVAIGVCKDCGVTVTEDNLGQKSPVVLCKGCVAKRQAEAKRKAEEERRRQEEAERAAQAAKAGRRAAINKRRAWSYSIAGIVTAGFVAFMLSMMTGGFDPVILGIAIGGGYLVFSFVFCLFYDCWVQEVVVDWFSKSLELPGLIFEFDVDGCLWYIGMKILFFFLKLLFGIVVGAFGIALGLIIAPFVFPYVLVVLHRDAVAGRECDLL
jgi:transcriptional regulator with XRE-family HTH domain